MFNRNGMYAQAPNYAGGGMVPASNFGMTSGGGGGMGGDMIGGGLAGLLGGMFGDSGAPYGDAMDEYQKWIQKAQETQNPFLKGGQEGLNHYKDMLAQMQNPSQFVNNLMSQYQQSPYAQYQQRQAMNAAQNIGSASGLTGSTPLMQFAQQNAQSIASGDQNQWMRNVLGVNSEALGGYGHLTDVGAGSANAMTNLYGQAGQNMAQMRYNQSQGGQNDMWNMIGGAAQLGLGLAML